MKLKRTANVLPPRSDVPAILISGFGRKLTPEESALLSRHLRELVTYSLLAYQARSPGVPETRIVQGWTEQWRASDLEHERERALKDLYNGMVQLLSEQDPSVKHRWVISLSGVRGAGPWYTGWQRPSPYGPRVPCTTGRLKKAMDVGIGCEISQDLLNWYPKAKVMKVRRSEKG